MNTTKEAIRNGYRITREDGAIFNVRKISVLGKFVWSIENELFQAIRAKTLSAAIADIENKQSKVTGWEKKTKKLVAKSKATGLFFNGTTFEAKTISEAMEICPGTTSEDFELVWGKGIEVAECQF